MSRPKGIERRVKYTGRVLRVGEESALIELHYKNRKFLSADSYPLSLFRSRIAGKGEKVICFAEEFKDGTHDCYFKVLDKDEMQYQKLLGSITSIIKKFKTAKDKLRM